MADAPAHYPKLEIGRRRDAPRPFGETSNPDEYVPREATEDVLRTLERAARGGRAVALTAPPGLGKSLLLRLLAKRLVLGFECLFLPYAAVTLDELCAWALGMIGSPAGDDPTHAFLRRVRRRAEEGQIVVLLIDDAGAMPLDTARGLGELLQRSGNRLRVVIAAADDAIANPVMAALHPETAAVRFVEPMSVPEMRRYVEARLEQAGISDALRDRFDEDAIHWIHRRSAGVPRRVHELASSLLELAPDGVGVDWLEERWLGAPIEDLESEAPETLEVLLGEDDCLLVDPIDR